MRHTNKYNLVSLNKIAKKLFKSCLCWVFVLLFAANHALAQKNTYLNTETIELPTVEIVSRKNLVEGQAGSKTQAVDTLLTKLYTTGSVADVLQQSGMYVRQYGSEGLATLSWRGTGSSQTAVAWQGFPLNGATLGLTDLSMLPVNLAPVTLIYGPGTIQPISGTIGGTVSMDVAPLSVSAPLSVNLQTEGGSFGLFNTEADVAYKSSRFFVAHRQAHNRFRLPDGSYQNNAAYRYSTAYASYDRQTSTSTLWQTNIWVGHHDREIQPPPNQTNDAGQQTRFVRYTLHRKQAFAKGYLATSLAWFSEQSHYIDEPQVNSLIAANQLMFRADATRQLHKKWTLSGGGLLPFSFAKVPAYQDNKAAQFEPLLYAYLKWQPNQRWLTDATVKLVPNSLPLPSVSSLYRLRQRKKSLLSLRGMAAMGFRVPTLNDRFWQPGGNPDLQPEQAYNIETGVAYRYAHKKVIVEASATLFHLVAQNTIQWLPQGGYWRPVNIKGDTRSQGAEAAISLSQKINSYWQWQANIKLTWNEALYPNSKRVIYAPLQQSSGTLGLNRKNLNLLLSAQYTSLRYTDAENNPTFVLPGFSTTDLQLSYKLRTKKKLSLQPYIGCYNVLNHQYINYKQNMPGRSFRFGVKADF